MQLEQIAARFGCTISQLKAQYLANALQMEKMAEKSRKTGRKVRGYTADQLSENAEKFKGWQHEPRSNRILSLPTNPCCI